MDKNLWLERWEQNLTGFHQAKINSYLQQHLPVLGLLPGDSVFVPLCGKSLDMSWLTERGHSVLGVEISPIAVRAYFQEAGAEPAESKSVDFAEFCAGKVRILCGDFFDLTAHHLKGVRGVYDRASLIALPAPMRKRYVDHLHRILDPHIRLLLITLWYPAEQMQGPPFPVSEQEVRELFEAKYSIECLSRQSVLLENSRFREKGLTELYESVYLLSSAT